jgi:hypothetical protein
VTYHITEDHIVSAIKALLDAASLPAPDGSVVIPLASSRWDPETRQQPVDELKRILPMIEEENRKAVDYEIACACAWEANEHGASNPIALSTVFRNIVHSTRSLGQGHKGFNCAPARLMLHQLLYLLDHTGLPAYEERANDDPFYKSWSEDMRECEIEGKKFDARNTFKRAFPGAFIKRLKTFRGEEDGLLHAAIEADTWVNSVEIVFADDGVGVAFNPWSERARLLMETPKAEKPGVLIIDKV